VDGRAIEEIGYYDPTKNPHEIKVDEIRALDWITKGAHLLILQNLCSVKLELWRNFINPSKHGGDPCEGSC
jgi:small subunit ribosomal protein S16